MAAANAKTKEKETVDSKFKKARKIKLISAEEAIKLMHSSIMCQKCGASTHQAVWWYPTPEGLKRVQVRYTSITEVDLRRIHSNSNGYVIKKPKENAYDWLYVLNIPGNNI